MPKDYPRAIKWITREIEELEIMKEIKEILIAAQKIQTDFFGKLGKILDGTLTEAIKNGL